MPLMTQTSQTLNKILSKIQEIHEKKDSQSMVVFDLDSTLFDVGPRLQKILHDFCHDPKFQAQFPVETAALKSAETQRTDWGLRQAVMRSGLESASIEFQHTLRDFWAKHFFSNEFLHYDKPYDGAVEFVQELWNIGAEIVYLTGRDVQRMGRGSEEVLLKWKMPLDGNQARLVLKPEKGMDDAKFKSDWFAQLPQGKYDTIWFFENEPVNVNLVRVEHQHIEVVFFDSTHSGKEMPPDDVPKILHFLFNK